MTALFSRPDRVSKTITGRFLATKGGYEGLLMSREFRRGQVFFLDVGPRFGDRSQGPVFDIFLAGPEDNAVLRCSKSVLTDDGATITIAIT